ncbi:glycosyltransferase [Aquimarina sp. RZ0]|uniref:glycosyltransferase n=1 Tax=Aquimarina sp. RZ0 TaxID=2607730 RepID=UPI0011F3C2F2|nr:nucleotide disphospho-sugar-binding domain-containing protein [Aquimarina sp. RZ0]KAA1246838.1 glycosyl transferase [Aquimarina sp. RZ0]
MANFLFVVPPFWGHINPTLSLGKVLSEAGHAVAWASMIDIDHLIPEGAVCYKFHQEEKGEDTLGMAYFDEIKQKGQEVFGIQSIQYLYEKVLIPIGLYMGRILPDIIDDFLPDVIINDHQAFAGAICAVRKNIPYATSITAPAAIKASLDFPKFLEWETEQIINLQKKLGVFGNKSIACSDQLSLVFSSKEFLGTEEFPDYYKFVGPLIEDRPTDAVFDWEYLKTISQPKILISIGTIFSAPSKRDFYLKVIDAFKDKNYLIILVADPDLFEQWPDNFIVQDKVPQLQLLPYLQAVICHGGHNTVCESMEQGLPLIVLPIAFDQSQVASRVAELHIGIRLKFKRLKPEHLSTALEKILNDPEYAKASKKIGDSFQKGGGLPRVLKELDLLSTNNFVKNDII